MGMDKIDFTTLSSKGQIVIPSATRKHLSLKPGTRLVLYTDGTNIVLKPIAQRDLAAFRKVVEKAGLSMTQKRKGVAS